MKYGLKEGGITSIECWDAEQLEKCGEGRSNAIKATKGKHGTYFSKAPPTMPPRHHT